MRITLLGLLVGCVEEEGLAIEAEETARNLAELHLLVYEDLLVHVDGATGDASPLATLGEGQERLPWLQGTVQAQMAWEAREGAYGWASASIYEGAGLAGELTFAGEEEGWIPADADPPLHALSGAVAADGGEEQAFALDLEFFFQDDVEQGWRVTGEIGGEPVDLEHRVERTEPPPEDTSGCRSEVGVDCG